jgi:ribose transport system substrate-binding protein
MSARSVVALAALILAAMVGCEKQPGAAATSAAPLRIAVVPKGTTHDFWKSVHAGAVKAARELGDVEITFRGPEKEDDREQQIALVQNLVSGRYDGIVLAPLDSQALVGPVRQATSAKIPVIIIDSGLAAEAGQDFISFIATNNHKGGRLGGEKLAQLLDGKGKVLLLRYQEGSASTTEREEGFLEAMAANPGITVLDPKRYAGATRSTAQEAAENLLAAHGDINGVFCPNESSTFGMLLALRARGMSPYVRFVGFDASEGLVQALREGDIHALVVQNPMKMGYLGVLTAVSYIRGRTVEVGIDTGVALVTKENMSEPEFKEALSPDLSQYLDGE